MTNKENNMTNENNKTVEVAYLVLQHTDGTFAVKLEDLTEPVEAVRVADASDVLSISQNIIKELETQALVNRIVLALQPATQPTISDKVKDALKERGIDPESTSIAE
jgi:hypothetical protein